MNELTHAVVILLAIACKVSDPKDQLVLEEIKALLVTLHERVELQEAHQSSAAGAAALERFPTKYKKPTPAMLVEPYDSGS